MSEFARFEKALQAAEAAGDVEAARALATDMRTMMQQGNPALGAPVDRRQQAARLTAKDTGAGAAAAISAGHLVDQLGTGILQLGLNLKTITPDGGPAEHAPIQAAAVKRLGEIGQEQQSKDISFGELRKEHPVATALGGAAPYIGVPGGLLGSSAMIGGLEAAQYGTSGERLRRGLTGTAGSFGGGLLGKGIGNMIAPVERGALGGAQQAALGSMDNMGIKPRLSQVTGSPFWGRMEDWAARTPGGAGVMRKFAGENQQAVNRTAAKGIGETADELSPQVFAAAQQRLGKVFEDMKGLPGKPIQINQNVSAAADDILRQQGKMLPMQQDPALIKLATDAKMMAANKGRIDGETYQLTRSGLSEAAFNAEGTNRVLYGKLLEALDDSAESSLRASGKGALADAIKAARPQYANLKTLEKGAVAEAGNVSPARLASAMRSRNPAAFREGRMEGNPLYDLAKYGEAFKPLQAGSPTYERTLTSNPISMILGAAGSYPTAKLATSQAAQWYPRGPGATPAAGLLGQAAQPLVRGGTMGLLQTPAGMMLVPIPSE